MDQYAFFAILAIVVSALRYVTYFITIYQGKTKPHAFSWLLWGIVTGIGTFAQIELEGGPSVWALAFVSITCLGISVLSFFIGEKEYTKSDWIALIIAIISIPIWKLTGNPLIAISMIVFIDMLTYWPTIRKSFHKPQSEPPISYFFAGSRYLLMLFAVPDPTWGNIIYPFFLMATDWGFVLYIIIRRAQLGYPLHEYAKEKAT